MRRWQVYVAACALPMLVALFAITYCVESPRWLLETGNHDGAMAALRVVAKRNEATMPCERLKQAASAGGTDELANKGPMARWYIYMKWSWRSIKGVFSRKLWKRSVMIWLA